MAQGKLVVVKRQYKDQVWREAIPLQEYQQWEQTHAEENSIIQDIRDFKQNDRGREFL